MRLARALRERPIGAVALLLATDPAATADVQAFCREGRHQLLASRREENVLRFVVRKGS